MAKKSFYDITVDENKPVNTLLNNEDEEDSFLYSSNKTENTAKTVLFSIIQKYIVF